MFWFYVITYSNGYLKICVGNNNFFIHYSLFFAYIVHYTYFSYSVLKKHENIEYTITASIYFLNMFYIFLEYIYHKFVLYLSTISSFLWSFFNRLAMSMERLDWSSDRIRESKKLMLETDEVGISMRYTIYEEKLSQQRQILLQARTKVYYEKNLQLIRNFSDMFLVCY